MDTWDNCFRDLKSLALTFTVPFSRPLDIDDFIRLWIRFTADTLLLVDVRLWTDSTDLRTFLRDKAFPPSTLSENCYLCRKFNARNLEKTGGLRIRWTNMVSEHLAIENDNTQVAIFHQVNALNLFSGR